MAKSEWAATTQLIEAARQVLAAESPMTVRQLFYRLVSVGVIENSLADYQKVSKAMTKARNDGRVEFRLIVDRSRPTYEAATWENLKEYSDSVLTSYRRDNWQEQRNYVEVWCEKDAVTGSIQQVTDKWAVPLRALRGFNSTTKAHEIADLFMKKTRSKKLPIVLYCGDWDPSGEAIEKDVERRVLLYGGICIMTRLAIHRADIKKFKLPPLKVKTADPRSSAFLRRHGAQAVELDALPPTELRARVDRGILTWVEMKSWQRALVLEEAQRETTARIARALSNGATR
jgi:hypothetical protein